MPKALKVDWTPIAIGYASGKTAEELGEEHGIKADAIRQRAKRKGWSKKALKEPITPSLEASHYIDTKGQSKELGGPASNAEIATIQLSRTVMAQFQAQKEAFLAAGGSVAVKGMQKVAECMESESNIYTIGQLGEIGESFTRIAKPVFGLDSGVTVNVATQVNVLSELPPDDLEYISE